MTTKIEKTVAIDFDGVIHWYDAWDGPVAKNHAISGAAEAIARLRSAGFKVVVFSTRPAGNVRAFLDAWGIRVDEVVDGKPYYVAFFDDRAHNVRTNVPNGLWGAVDEWLIGRPDLEAGTVDDIQADAEGAEFHRA